MQKHVQTHYVRTYRKITALTQGDVSKLLGHESSNAISKIEHYQSLPNLTTAIALALTLDVPFETLFAGLFDQTHKKIRKRAATRLKGLNKLKNSRRRNSRVKSIKKLAAGNLATQKQTYESQK